MRNFIWKYRSLLFCAGMALAVAGIFNSLIPLIATENILVSAKPIKANSKITPTALAEVRIPKHLLHKDYFQHQEQLVDKVIRYNIPAGMPILQNMVFKGNTKQNFATITIAVNGYLPANLTADVTISLYLPEKYLTAKEKPTDTGRKTAPNDVNNLPEHSGDIWEKTTVEENPSYLAVPATYLSTVSTAGLLGNKSSSNISIAVEQKYIVAILKASAANQVFIATPR